METQAGRELLWVRSSLDLQDACAAEREQPSTVAKVVTTQVEVAEAEGCCANSKDHPRMMALRPLLLLVRLRHGLKATSKRAQEVRLNGPSYFSITVSFK